MYNFSSPEKINLPCTYGRMLPIDLLNAHPHCVRSPSQLSLSPCRTEPLAGDLRAMVGILPRPRCTSSPRVSSEVSILPALGALGLSPHAPPGAQCAQGRLSSPAPRTPPR